MTLQSAYNVKVQEIAATISDMLKHEATALNVSPIGLSQSVRAALDEMRVGINDNRAVGWNARLRLYLASNLSDVVADSDEGRPQKHPGDTVLRGLPTVCAWVADLASAHHKAPCAGLDPSTLRRKLASLRTQISQRGDGTGTLRTYYTVMRSARFGAQEEIRMFARCDVTREDVAQKIEVDM